MWTLVCKLTLETFRGYYANVRIEGELFNIILLACLFFNDLLCSHVLFFRVGREAHEEINITFTLPLSWNSDDCVLHGHCEQVVFSTCMTITAASNIFPVTVWVGWLVRTHCMCLPAYCGLIQNEMHCPNMCNYRSNIRWNFSDDYRWKLVNDV